MIQQIWNILQKDYAQTPKTATRHRRSSNLDRRADWMCAVEEILPSGSLTLGTVRLLEVNRTSLFE
jgi:hypothetical protein